LGSWVSVSFDPVRRALDVVGRGLGGRFLEEKQGDQGQSQEEAEKPARVGRIAGIVESVLDLDGFLTIG